MTELDKQLERQKETISKLQDRIKLLRFDISQLNSEKIELNEKLRKRRDNVKNVRAELMTMKRTENFSRINSVLAMLKAGFEDEE
jgi:chromosome segregation ATPase